MAERSSSRQRLGSAPGATGGGPSDGGGSGGGARTSIEALPDACLSFIFEHAGTVNELG